MGCQVDCSLHLCEKANIAPIFKKSIKDDSRNYQSMSLTFELGKTME